MPNKALKREEDANNDGLSLWLVLNVLTHVGYIILSSLLNLFPGLLFYFFQISLFALNITRMHDSLYDDSKTLGAAPLADRLSKTSIITRNIVGAATFALTIAAYALLFISPIAPLLFIATECLWSAYALGKYALQLKNYVNDDKARQSRFFKPKIVSSSISLLQQLGMAAATVCLFLIPGVQIMALSIIVASIILLVGVKFWENKQLLKIGDEIKREQEKKIINEERKKSAPSSDNKPNKSSKLTKTSVQNEASSESTPLIANNPSSYFRKFITSASLFRTNTKRLK